MQKKHFISVSAALLSAVLLTGCGADRSRSSYDRSSSSQYQLEVVPAEDTTEAQTEPETEPDSVSEAEPETEPETVPETFPEAEPAEEPSAEPETWADYSESTYVEYHFRSKKLLDQHFEKHGGEFDSSFGYETAADYEKGASDVINAPDALHKTEADDGDYVYYIEATNEFVILSQDGYIRTYFLPSAGKKYYDRQ
ncbi:MAG: hypothetical protein IJ874_05620 [Ruminococcus sp.]|nr:hypothetical protein [Ruminococcus sp.]